jgi:hypothetical protein
MEGAMQSDYHNREGNNNEGKNLKIPRFRGCAHPQHHTIILHDKYLTWRCRIDETSSDFFYEKAIFY